MIGDGIYEYRKKLWKKIDQREHLLDKKEKEYGDTFPTMFNYPEIRNWYSENVSYIDDEIVKLANEVLLGYNKERIKDIRDVYDNDFLIELHVKENSLNKPKKR